MWLKARVNNLFSLVCRRNLVHFYWGEWKQNWVQIKVVVGLRVVLEFLHLVGLANLVNLGNQRHPVTSALSWILNHHTLLSRIPIVKWAVVYLWSREADALGSGFSRQTWETRRTLQKTYNFNLGNRCVKFVVFCSPELIYPPLVQDILHLLAQMAQEGQDCHGHPKASSQSKGNIKKNCVLFLFIQKLRV